ncbi:hypothetical protein L1987_37081 [Smallanthus sonchifolius]|uniref:Uncharacterized protein n=1 Tax=Smallanthus sonchifolius TaxID=185202 RepID=A0ACB9HFD1_9ASTR|nr:hypothetical protein L1987_37081 [Smallanthus sonchifolius]
MKARLNAAPLPPMMTTTMLLVPSSSPPLALSQSLFSCLRFSPSLFLKVASQAVVHHALKLVLYCSPTCSAAMDLSNESGS